MSKRESQSVHIWTFKKHSRIDKHARSHMDLTCDHLCYERSPWKSLYLRKKQIISNWRSRAIQSSTVLEDDFKYPIRLQIHSGRIIAGTQDYKLRVWNVEDAQPAFAGKYIVCSRFDLTLRVWCGRCTAGAQLHVLQGHTGLTPCMSLHGTTLVSGSHDQTLRVWDIVDGKCLHILTGHLRRVNLVKFDGERVVSNSDDFTVKVWNVHTEECLHTLTGHTTLVASLLFEPERDLVVWGSREGTIRVWDVQRGRCIAHLVCLQELGFTIHFEMQLRGNILVRGYDSDIWVWDIREGGSCIHHLHGVNGQTSTITSLQLLDSGLLVTGSMNGSVMLCDVKKGTFVRDLIRSRSGYPSRYYWDLKATGTLLVCGEGTKIICIDFDAAYP